MAYFENSESDREILDESEILDYKKKSDLSAELKGNMEEKGGHYFVVYPSDEEEDKGEKITKLREEEETCLAVNMSVALCLKKKKVGRRGDERGRNSGLNTSEGKMSVIPCSIQVACCWKILILLWLRRWVCPCPLLINDHTELELSRVGGGPNN